MQFKQTPKTNTRILSGGATHCDPRIQPRLQIFDKPPNLGNPQLCQLNSACKITLTTLSLVVMSWASQLSLHYKGGRQVLQSLSLKVMR